MPMRPPPADSRIALVDTIDFSRLLDKDLTERYKLLALCVKDGFFYLDLGGPRTHQILFDKTDIVAIMEKYFSLPEDVKMRDNRGTHTHGFKPAGTFTGFKEGARDGYETLKVAYAEMMSRSPLLPSAVKQQGDLFESFIGLCHLINKTMLTTLSDMLNLQGATRFEAHHREDKLSNTTLVLLHYPKQDIKEGMGHNKHTDIGTLTLLFTEQWGLQLQQPGSGEWEFIAPRDGHAIVNVGDSLRYLSEKKLNSCLHRVIPVASDEDRYSIAYFLRPENEAHFEDVEGNKVKAAQWHDNKYVMFSESHERQANNGILTGGMERPAGILAKNQKIYNI